MPRTVCVTGASGYCGTSLVLELLRNGDSVHACARSETEVEQWQSAFRDEPGVVDGRLRFFVVPNIDVAGAIDEAVRGCDAVGHLAMPIFPNIQARLWQLERS